MDQTSPDLRTYFSSIKDPRVDRTKRHKLINIIIIALTAILAGADNWVEVEAFGWERLAWLSSFLDLPNGIPSHDTFTRVFNRIDPDAFSNAFIQWTRSVEKRTNEEIIAIDGKVLRGSHDGKLGRGAIDMVSAWATEQHLVLAQQKVDQKSNEITAIPTLLSFLDLHGCIVTIDAMGTQTAIAEQIIAQGGNYILALKGNQGQLHEDVQRLFSGLEASDYRAYKHDYFKTIDKNHGRIEERECWVITDKEVLKHLRGFERWEKLTSVVRIRSRRHLGKGEVEVADRYFLSSVTGAKRILRGARSHWGIENQLHWVLDITFGEDKSRLRRGHGAENFAVLRHFALNMLRLDKSRRGSVKKKRLMAAWNPDFLQTLLSEAFS